MCTILSPMEQRLAGLLDTYTAALQQPELGEESGQKWRELKEAIEAVFSQRSDEIESLQRQLEVAQSESRAAWDRVEGLQNELQAVTCSLVQLQQSSTQEVGSAASHSGAGTGQDLEPNGDQDIGMESQNSSHSVEMGPITSKQELEPQASATTITENTQMATNSNDTVGMESGQTHGAEAGIPESVQGPAGLQWIRRGSCPWVWLYSPPSLLTPGR